jgi:hypothetical protein
MKIINTGIKQVINIKIIHLRKWFYRIMNINLCYYYPLKIMYSFSVGFGPHAISATPGAPVPNDEINI